MNKLKFIIFSDSAFFSSEDNKLNIIGIYDTIYADNFPAVQTSLIVSVSVESLENFNIRFALKKVGTETVVFDQSQPVILKENTTVSNIINEFQGVPFVSEGTYHLEVYIDGEKQSLVGKLEVKRTE